MLLAAVMGLLFVACSASPVKQNDPGATTSAPAPSPEYGALTKSIEQAITSGSVSLDTINAVLVNVDGQTVVTHYRNGHKPGQAQHVFSVTKSVLSVLVGIALDENLIEDVDAPLAELLPSNTAKMSGEMASVTLRQLLTMSAGLPDDDTDSSSFAQAIRQDRGAVDVILKRPLVNRSGETFTYSNASAHLVSAVLTEALRQADGSKPRTVLDYATEKLFEPLGIDTRDPYTARFDPDHPAPFEKAGFGWATDAEAINIGAGQLRLRPADLLKIGQLYLDNGKWQDQQLVPAEWIAASIAPSAASDIYGFMWWLEKTARGDSAYAARGFGGQLLVVVPNQQLVVVVTAKPTEDYATDSNTAFALVSEVILTTFHR